MAYATNIFLCNVEWDKETPHRYDWGSPADRDAWFTTRGGSKMGPTQPVKWDQRYAEIKWDNTNDFSYNYLRFTQNGRVWYAFIDSWGYINPNVIFVRWTIDSWTTFQFDCEFLPSYIVRQHQDRVHIVGDYVEPIADNLYVPEDTEKPGYYKNNLTYTVQQKYDAPLFIYVVKINLGTGSSSDIALSTVNRTINVPLCIYFTAIRPGAGSPFTIMGKPAPSVLEMVQFLESASDIIGVYASRYMPVNYTMNGLDIIMPDGSYDRREGEPPLLFNNELININMKLPKFQYQTPVIGKKYGVVEWKTLIETEQPWRNVEPKLDVYPYRFFQGVHHNEEYAMIDPLYIDYENFRANIAMSLLGEASEQIYFDGYDGPNQEYRAKVFNRLPQFPFKNDGYLQYIRQNQNAIVTGYVKSGLMTAIGIAGLWAAVTAPTLNPLGVAGMAAWAVGSTLDVTNKAAKQEDAKELPDSLNGSLSSVLSFITATTEAAFLEKNCSDDLLDRVGRYFMMFGYAKERLDMVNYHTRDRYDYIRTKNVGVKASIAKNYVDDIRQLFDSGVTIWHAGTGNMYDYFNTNNWEVSIDV